MRASGLDAACVANIVALEWHKLAAFLPGALVCSLTRLDVATSMLDPDLARLRARLAKEITALAAAEGAPINDMPVWLTGAPTALLGDAEDTMVAGYRIVGERTRAQGVALYPSMTTDIMAGRPTELEGTAGDLLLRADRHRFAVPALRACTELLRGIERAHHNGAENAAP
ncbi:MAG: ketopantoate reductase C-terminal domain-containing protein [Dehalococcoidia bacterium]